MEGLWLFNRTISGPALLVGYVLLVAATLLFLRWKLAQLDRTDELPISDVPSEPDPYELAYLRGGIREVARLAMLSLVERGYLHVDRSDRGKARLEQVRPRPDLAVLGRIERRVYEHCWKGRTPREVATDAGLGAHLENICRRVRERLDA